MRQWVKHFSDNPKYESTSIANKVIYLMQYLAPLKVKYKVARALLVQVENEVDKELEQGEENVRVDIEGAEEEDVNARGNDGRDDDDGSQDDLSDVEEMDIGEESERASDDEMAEDPIEEEIEVQESDQEKEGRLQREFEIGRYLDKTDKELFESNLVVPNCVKRSVKYQLREKNFITAYLEQEDFQDSQEVLEALSQASEVVEDALKEKLSHLTNQEKATRLLTKSISDTIQRLKETPGKEARQQLQIILAATSHHK